MHPLVVRAKETIRSWTSDQPRDLGLAVSALCRDILDHGGLPGGSPDWTALRAAFDVKKGDSIGETFGRWDHWCRHADVDLEDRAAFVKMGIVTVTVKWTLKKFGMLSGPPAPIPQFGAWKEELCESLDKFIPDVKPE